jgi:hypothetical protein
MKETLLLFVALLIGACEKDASKPETFKADAVVIWQKNPGENGKGLWVQIAGKTYKVINEEDFDARYKSDRTTAKVEYQIAKKVQFADIASHYQAEGIIIINFN